MWSLIIYGEKRQLRKQVFLFQAKEAAQFNPFTATDSIVDAAVTKSKRKQCATRQGGCIK